MTTETMDPGIYPGYPETIYHQRPECSNSRLNTLAQSAEDCRWAMDNPSESSDAMKLGSYVHTSLLETHLVSDRHAVFDGDRRTKAGKAEWLNLTTGIGEDNVINAKQHDAAVRMIDSVSSHRAASAILKATEQRELTVLAEINGLMMRGRLDGWAPTLAGGMIVDIKTARDVDERGFKRAVYERGYFRQGACYRALMREHGHDPQGFAIIAVQNSAPYKTRVYTLLPEVLDEGERDLMRLIMEYSSRVKDNDWSGDDGLAQDLDLSSFAWRELNNN